MHGKQEFPIKGLAALVSHSGGPLLHRSSNSFPQATKHFYPLLNSLQSAEENANKLSKKSSSPGAARCLQAPRPCRPPSGCALPRAVLLAVPQDGSGPWGACPSPPAPAHAASSLLFCCVFLANPLLQHPEPAAAEEEIPRLVQDPNLPSPQRAHRFPWRGPLTAEAFHMEAGGFILVSLQL